MRIFISYRLTSGCMTANAKNDYRPFLKDLAFLLFSSLPELPAALVSGQMMLLQVRLVMKMIIYKHHRGPRRENSGSHPLLYA